MNYNSSMPIISRKLTFHYTLISDVLTNSFRRFGCEPPNATRVAPIVAALSSMALSLAADVVKDSINVFRVCEIFPLVRLAISDARYRSKYDWRIVELVSLCGLAVKYLSNAVRSYASCNDVLWSEHCVGTRSRKGVVGTMNGRNASFPLCPGIIVVACAISLFSANLRQMVSLSKFGAFGGNPKYLNIERVQQSLPLARHWVTTASATLCNPYSGTVVGSGKL
jgi:hypothetical protein